MTAELVEDCPRCSASRTSHDVKSSNFLRVEHGWQFQYELFGVCRHCKKSTTFQVQLREAKHSDSFRGTDPAAIRGSLNQYFNVTGFVSLKDRAVIDAPKYLPDNIKAAFDESATCFSVQCWNASAAMLRLCIDLATKPMLPTDDAVAPPRKVRRDLGLRLPWLFDNGLLPSDLRELAKCIREDGNDGAHDGTLSKADAEDVLDFAKVLLDRVFTEKERLRLAEERRDQRRKMN